MLRTGVLGRGRSQREVVSNLRDAEVGVVDKRGVLEWLLRRLLHQGLLLQIAGHM